MRTKYKRLMSALSAVVLAAGTGILFPAGAWATVDACVPASGLANEGFVASAAELEYVIQEGIAEVKVANNFTIVCQPTIMTESLKIDLNGKTVTANAPWALDLETANKTLTIEDSGSGGTIDFNDAGIWIQGGANLTIKSGTVSVSAGRGRGIVLRDGALSLEGGVVAASNGASNGGYYPTIVVLNDATTDTSVTISGGVITATNGTALSVQNAVNVTMTDGSIIGGDTGVMLDDGASFTMDGGAITASTWGVAAFNDTEFTMNDGTLTVSASDGIGVAGNGTSNPEANNYGGNARLTLNGGTIESGDLGVYAPQVGGVTVLGDGLTINAAKCGVEVRAGTLNVNGATINVDENAEYAFNPNGSGSTASGVGIAVAQHTTTQAISANVTSGDFTAPVAFAEANPQHNSEEAIAEVSVAISGGNFVATNGDPVVASEDLSGFITGGTYSKALSDEYVAEGYLVYSDDIIYTVAATPTVNGLASSYEAHPGDTVALSYTLLPAVGGNVIDFLDANATACGDEDCVWYDDENGALVVNENAEAGEYTIEYYLIDDLETPAGSFSLIVSEPEPVNPEPVDPEPSEPEYYVGDHASIYGVRVGSEEYYYVYTENVNAVIADESIAKFETVTEQSGEYTYENTVIRGLKAGVTEIEFTLADGTVVESVPLKVYEVATTLKGAQAVGTSQTFTVTVSEGYEIEKVTAYAPGMTSSEDGTEPSENDPIAFAKNADGSYTLTMKKMPFYEDGNWDEEAGEWVPNGEIIPCPWASVEVALVDADGNEFYDNFSVIAFELATTDEAAEVVNEETEAVETNEAVMQEHVAELVAGVIEKQDEAVDNTLTLTLESGAVAEISDVDAFVDAVMAGETIEAVLTEPAVVTEEEMDEATVNDMKGEMGEGKTGHRFVDVNVELRAGDTTFGRMTELNEPLMVGVDVSDDEEVPEGYTRKYSVVRNHEGKSEKLDDDDVEYDEDGKIVRFRSSRFSTYLIAYVDEPDAVEPTDPVEPEPTVEPTEPEPTDEPTEPEPTVEPTEPETPVINPTVPEIETKDNEAKAADTGKFTSEGGSATSNIAVFVVTMGAILAAYGAYKFIKRKEQRK